MIVIIQKGQKRDIISYAVFKKLPMSGTQKDTFVVTYYVILSAAKDLIARNTIDKYRIYLKLRYFTQNDNQARIVATLTNSHLW